MGGRDLNTGLHVCTANTLPMELYFCVPEEVFTFVGTEKFTYCLSYFSVKTHSDQATYKRKFIGDLLTVSGN